VWVKPIAIPLAAAAVARYCLYIFKISKYQKKVPIPVSAVGGVFFCLAMHYL
jgi:hypothetical protein